MNLLQTIVTDLSEEREPDIKEVKDSEVTKVILLLKKMKQTNQELYQKQLALEVKEQEARFKMLQEQINPHFLHNTLDNIYCIAQIEEIEPIIVLTKNLSNMMRYSLSEKQTFVELNEELEHVKTYLNILNIRYENKFHLNVEISPELLHAKVIKLMLQPLVENSCIHGILPKSNTFGTIQIKAVKKENDLIIYVQDDGVGIAQDTIDKINMCFREDAKSIRIPQGKGFGIALINVHDRIRLINGEGYGLSISGTELSGCCIEIRQKLMFFE